MRATPQKRFDILFALLHKYEKQERPAMPHSASEMAGSRASREIRRLFGERCALFPASNKFSLPFNLNAYFYGFFFYGFSLPAARSLSVEIR
jgi:hypothetical protein